MSFYPNYVTHPEGPEYDEDPEYDEPDKCQMYEIVIGIWVGEYEHCEDIYYMGTLREAERYADAYLSEIWGVGETIWDDLEQGWMSKDGERGARLSSIRPYETIVAMTEKGTLSYRMEFHLD